MARPSEFTPEKGDAICERLANGESLRSVCRDPNQPDFTTVMRWLEANEPFRKQYIRAREIQAETLFEEILEIADDSSGDVVENSKGEKSCDNEFVQRSRLRVDARKWYLSKMVPKKYGEKLETEHSGTIEVVRREVKDA